MTCIPREFVTYFTCISDVLLHRILLYSEPVVFRGVFLVIAAVFCPVFYCILTPLYSECISECISMSPECILLYSRERHFLVPPTHPPTRFYREYVFRYRILMYSQSLFKNTYFTCILSRILVYSLIIQEYGQNTEGHICPKSTLSKYGRIQRISKFRIRQNTEQNTAEYR